MSHPVVRDLAPTTPDRRATRENPAATIRRLQRLTEESGVEAPIPKAAPVSTALVSTTPVSTAPVFIIHART